MGVDNMKCPQMGVIRWDYLCVGDKHTNCELRSLSPRDFHFNVPFFLNIDSKDCISGTENTQEIIDCQIQYAQNAGIDYWAFTLGTELGENDNECYALKKYLASSVASSLNFCLILHKYRKETWMERLHFIVSCLCHPSHVRVLGNRPIIYLFDVRDIENEWGEGVETEKIITKLRTSALAAGAGNPYIVSMTSEKRMVASIEQCKRYGLDAISAYSFAGLDRDGNSLEELPFAHLANENQMAWKMYADTRFPFIPNVSLGRNEKPRYINPPPWGGGHGPFWQYPSASEIADQISCAINFVRQNEVVCEADTFLCYAWNEYNEGGWLCPTHSEGTSRLDAVSSVLRKNKR